MGLMTLKLKDLNQINCGEKSKQIVRLLIVQNGNILISKHEVISDDMTLFGKKLLLSGKDITVGAEKYYKLLLTPILDEREMEKTWSNLFKEDGSDPDQEQMLSVNEDGFYIFNNIDVKNLATFKKSFFSEPYIKLEFKENLFLIELSFVPCSFSPWGVKTFPNETKNFFKELKSKIIV